MKIIVLLFILFIGQHSGFSTTWDEPWRKEIIEKSDYLVFAEVLQNDEKKGFEIKVLKSIGNSIEGELTINGFFMLHICSSSNGHGPKFNFKKGMKGYFFLKKGKRGKFLMPTPTAGFDRVDNNEVYATYRHSYHQALVPVATYELTYSEIWDYYHRNKYQKDVIKKFIDEQMSLPVATLENGNTPVFFAQHVALETAYLMEIPIDFSILKKYVDVNAFHCTASAFRAMQNCTYDECSALLLDFILDNEKSNFNKVLAIRTLWKIANKAQKAEIWEMKEKFSDEDTGFGGNIMDPRICTHYPSPKNAVIELKNGY